MMQLHGWDSISLVMTIMSTYARLEVDEDCAWNIMLVISLVEEYVFAVSAFGSPLLKNAFLVDSVFCTEALPVYSAHLFFLQPLDKNV